VVDKDESEKDRTDVQKTMLGPEVLDSEHYPEILFKSISAETSIAGTVDPAWKPDAAGADAASHGASNAQGWPLHRRSYPEIDRLRN